MAADASICRFDADDATMSGGITNRTAGVGTEGALAKPGGQRGTRTAARSAGDMRGVPRIPHGGEGRIHRRPAESELMNAKFSEKNRAGLSELRRSRRIVIRNPILQNRGMTSRADALRCVEVFQCNRNPMQRPAIFSGV